MKSIGVTSLDSSLLIGGGNAKLGSKHQRLLQDYLVLQKENVLIKNRLKISKQKKLKLAAEVRFLRRRYKLLSKMNSIASSKEPNHGKPSISTKRNKIIKKRSSTRKENALQRLPPIPELKYKKNCTREQIAYGGSLVIDPYQETTVNVGHDANNVSNLIPALSKYHNGRARGHKESLAQNRIPFLDLNPKKRIHAANDSFSRNSMRIFDLNQDTLLKGKEISLPSRSLVFDLNEISTGDEEFQANN